MEKGMEGIDRLCGGGGEKGPLDKEHSSLAFHFNFPGADKDAGSAATQSQAP